MLVLFKPWRKGTDLKSADKLWDEEFQQHSFSEEERRYLCNFNVRYECLDARDDYQAQMKKAGDMIIGSWDNDDVHEVDMMMVFKVSALTSSNLTMLPYTLWILVQFTTDA